MKHIKIIVLLIILSSVFIGCETTSKEKPSKDQPSSTTKKVVIEENSTTNNSTLITDFLQDVNTLKGIENPIINFIKEAEETTKLKIYFNIDTIEAVLNTAKNYDYLVIVVDQHTIIKITELDKCITSGSWKTCMPFAEGFIKRKSNLEYKNDYCNNIIGRPDTQERVAYFFSVD